MRRKSLRPRRGANLPCITSSFRLNPTITFRSIISHRPVIPWRRTLLRILSKRYVLRESEIQKTLSGYYATNYVDELVLIKNICISPSRYLWILLPMGNPNQCTTGICLSAIRCHQAALLRRRRRRLLQRRLRPSSITRKLIIVKTFSTMGNLRSYTLLSLHCVIIQRRRRHRQRRQSPPQLARPQWVAAPPLHRRGKYLRNTTSVGMGNLTNSILLNVPITTIHIYFDHLFLFLFDT